jgi:hypothetical protein
MNIQEIPAPVRKQTWVAQHTANWLYWTIPATGTNASAMNKTANLPRTSSGKQWRIKIFKWRVLREFGLMDLITELLRFHRSFLENCVRAMFPVFFYFATVHYSFLVNSDSSAYGAGLETENRGTMPIKFFSELCNRPDQPRIT